MENKTIAAGELFQPAETQAYAQLIISEGAQVLPPEGKLLTLTAKGIELPIAPGTYTDAVLTVTENYSGIVDDFNDDGYRTALFISGGEIVQDRSVTSALSGGSYDAKAMKGAAITSENDYFSGAIIKDGTYTFSDLKVTMKGNGYNDFSGKGAAIVATGDARVEVENADIRTYGVIRGCALSADNAHLTVKHSYLEAMGGTDEESEQLGNALHNMTSVPWMLGISGNNRATNIVGSGTAVYEDCTIRAERWGVLSTDGVDSPKNFGDYQVNMYVKDSLVEITGESGYGSYCIGACRNVYDHTTFNVPDYALIIANEYASSDFVNGSVVNSDRFGVMWHQNQRGVLKVENSSFNTGLTSFLVKGCYPEIRLSGASLNPGNGVILQLMDSDDPGMGFFEYKENTAEPVKVPEHDVTKENFTDCSIFGMDRTAYPTDAKIVFKDMCQKGDLYNSTTGACRVGMVIPAGENPMAASHGDEGPGGPGEHHMPPMEASTERPINLVVELENACLEGVVSASVSRHAADTITPENREQLGQVVNTVCPVVNNGVLLSLDAGSKWIVTGPCFLSSLTLAEGAVVEGVGGKAVCLTVDGQQMPLASGTYKGELSVTLG